MSDFYKFEFLICSAITAITQLKMKFLKEQKATVIENENEINEIHIMVYSAITDITQKTMKL